MLRDIAGWLIFRVTRSLGGSWLTVFRAAGRGIGVGAAWPSQVLMDCSISKDL